MIPHNTKKLIVERLIQPDTLKSAKTIWGRELKLLKQLETEFDSPDFWLTFKLHFGMLHSFAWFKTKEGRAELVNQWNMYRFQRAQEEEKAVQVLENSLDTACKTGTLDSTLEQTVPLAPRENPLTWADSN